MSSNKSLNTTVNKARRTSRSAPERGLAVSVRTVLEDAKQEGEPVLWLSDVCKRLGHADDAELARVTGTIAVVYTTARKDQLVAVREAADAIARHDAVLADAFVRARKRLKSSNAFSVTQLLKDLPKMPRGFGKIFEMAFRASLVDRHAARELLAIRIGGRPHYFFVSDLAPGLAVWELDAGHDGHPKANGTPHHDPAPIDQDEFVHRFESAFARFDRATGGHNLVSLVDLRRELADVPRLAFDDALQHLRRARRFSLNSADGRHGLSTEEREAGIVEEDALLLFVSRRDAGGVT